MFRKLVTLIILILPLNLVAQEVDLLILNRQYNQALEKIDQALQQQPDANLYFKKGIVLEKLMNFDAATHALIQTCRLDSTNHIYLEELAEAYSGMGNYRDASICLEAATRLDTLNLPLKSKLGMAYINMKAYQQAYLNFDEIYRKDSTNNYYNRYYAYAAYRSGREGRAVKLYEELMKTQVKDVNVYLNLATIHNRNQKQQQAHIALLHGLRLFPKHPSLLLKWADTYFQYKEYAKAQNPYEQYLATGDSIFDVLKNYGICLYFTHYEEEALNMLGKCYEMVKNDPILNFYIGASYKKLKQFDESVDFLKLAIETATPDYLAEIYHHLGQVYGWQREFEKSIEIYKKALELEPEKVELLYEIATTYEEFNFNKTLALNYYQSYLDEAGIEGEHAEYALNRVLKIKEELFMNE